VLLIMHNQGILELDTFIDSLKTLKMVGFRLNDAILKHFIEMEQKLPQNSIFYSPR